VNRVRDAARDQRGQSLVEFAFVLPVILLIITGLFDVARAVWQENTLAYAAREGTRYAIVHGSGYPDPALIAWPNNTTQITTVVRNAAVGVSNITVTTTWPDGCYERNCRVNVEASTAFVPLPSSYLLGGAFQITLRGGSELVIQR
jgi:Flp pilus assembly protein TadG